MDDVLEGTISSSCSACVYSSMASSTRSSLSIANARLKRALKCWGKRARALS